MMMMMTCNSQDHDYGEMATTTNNKQQAANIDYNKMTSTASSNTKRPLIERVQPNQEAQTKTTTASSAEANCRQVTNQQPVLRCQSSMQSLNLAAPTTTTTTKQQTGRFKFSLAGRSNNSSSSFEISNNNTKGTSNNNNIKRFSSIMSNHQLIKSIANVSKTEAPSKANVSQLHAAANEGNVDLVRLLLRSGADVNSQESQFGNTPLHQAAWNGFSQTVEVLCKYRANTSIRNKAQFTPLHLACQQGHNQTIRLLLMANAKTEAKNGCGDTPLHTAARYGHAGAARILLSAKCDPNQVNKNHDTPLHITAAMGRRKLTKILMQNGAEPAIKNKQNETPMDIALKKDLIDIQELIANPPPIEQRNSKRHTQSSTTHHRLLLPESPLPLVTLAPASSSKTLRRNSRQNCRHSAGPNHRRSRGRRRTTDGMPPSDSGNSSSELEDIILGQRRPNNKRRTNTAATGSGVKVEPLALDVPDESGGGGTDKWGVTLTSARSMSALANRYQAARRLRTRTLGGTGSGTDLQLLSSSSHLAARAGCTSGGGTINPTTRPNDFDSGRSPIENRRRSTTPAGEPLNGTSNIESPNREGQLLLLPDAKPLLKEWNELAAKRVRETPTVIEEPNNLIIRNNSNADGHVDHQHDDDELDYKRETKRGTAKKASSPNGSFRSSLSKSRGRLLLNRHRNGARRAKTLVRRPNLGTCVGKLSLLKLRNMVNQSQKTRQQQQQVSNQNQDHEEKKQEDEADNDKQDELVALPDESIVVVEGRRQERLLKQQQQQQVAPNGTRLVSTRLLAPLDDETQLYAIPKKTKQQTTNGAASSKQQVASGGATNAAGGQPAATSNGDISCRSRQESSSRLAGTRQQQQVEGAAASSGNRTPSAGPVLTSDGGLSSSSSISSSAAAANNNNLRLKLKLNGKEDDDDERSAGSSRIASSSDECIDAISQQHLVGGGGGRQTDRQPAVVGVHGLEPNDTGSCLRLGPARPLTKEEAAAAAQDDRRYTSVVNQACIGQQHQQQQVSGASTDGKQNQGTRKQVVEPILMNGGKGKPTASSKLRQFLHLDSRPRAASSAKQADHSSTPPIAAGYYAYSPPIVSQSSGGDSTKQQELIKASNIVVDSTDSATNGKNSTTTGKTRTGSWIRSKLSLASSTNDDSSAAAAASNGQQKKLDKVNGGLVLNGTRENSSKEQQQQQERPTANCLLLVEAPLNKDGAELATSSMAEAQQEKTEQQDSRLVEDDAEIKDGDGLIRPKSALSATSADLIAAQKSLAAAAAAKVKRDRMAKIMCVADDGGGDKLAMTTKRANETTLLTVKTSGENFWPQAHHHHQQHQLQHHRIALHEPAIGSIGQPVNGGGSGGGGKPFMLMVAANQPMIVEQQNRSGANSVGMSDSSPSNNGAESDNSIQTTSGSMSTADNASNNTQQSGLNFSSSDQSQSNSSPLGMLSRILLNNKQLSRPTFSSSSGGATLLNSSSSSATEATLVAESKSATGEETITNNNNNNKEEEQQTRNGSKQLEQLESRSRRPIVLTKSNDEVPPSASNGCCYQTMKPELPPKGALRISAARCAVGLPSTTEPHHDVDSNINGLPRVASYTQISTANNNNNKILPLHLMQLQRQPLCDYHAFARHSQYNNNNNNKNIDIDRSKSNAHFYVSSGGFEDLSQADHDKSGVVLGARGAGNNPPPPPALARSSYSTTSHHDLRSLMQLELRQQQQQQHPTSVINYEYYLEPAPNSHQAAALGYEQQHNMAVSRYNYHNNHNNGNQRTSSLSNDNSIYPLASSLLGAGKQMQYAHDDDSIYVHSSASYANPNANQSRDCGTQRDCDAAFSRLSYNGQQPRPKSSLDTFLLSSNRSNQITSNSNNNHNHNNNNGRQQQSNNSSATTIINGTKGNHHQAGSPMSGSNIILANTDAKLTDQRSTPVVAVERGHNRQQQQHQRRSSLSSQLQHESSSLLLGCSEYFNNSPHLSQPAAAYYSPFIHHNGKTIQAASGNSYLYTTTNDDPAQEHQSDLTVLPAPAAYTTANAAIGGGCGSSQRHHDDATAADSTYHRKQSPSSPSIELESDPAAIVVAEGGSSISHEMARTANDNEEDESRLNRGGRADSERQRKAPNSWKPAPPTTYKSLVHINQSSPVVVVDKSNQSSARISVIGASNGTGAIAARSNRTVLLTNGNSYNGPKSSSTATSSNCSNNHSNNKVVPDRRPVMIRSGMQGIIGANAAAVDLTRDGLKKIDYNSKQTATRLTARPVEVDMRVELDELDEECGRSTML